MDRTVVIYKGKYGATEQYARWISEALSCDMVDADHFLGRDFEKYDNIIYGGALQAGGIKGFELIKKNSMGAFDPSKIKGMDKSIINLTLKMLKKKKEEQWTEDERRLYHDMTEGADYMDRKYIEPIVKEFIPDWTMED